MKTLDKVVPSKIVMAATYPGISMLFLERYNYLIVNRKFSDFFFILRLGEEFKKFIYAEIAAYKVITTEVPEQLVL